MNPHTHSSHLTSPPSPLAVISLGMGQFCGHEGLVRTTLPYAISEISSRDSGISYIPRYKMLMRVRTLCKKYVTFNA
jgi:hypothetical protein